MTLRELYYSLKKDCESAGRRVAIPDRGIEILKIHFVSKSCELLPGAYRYPCAEHGKVFNEDCSHGDQDIFQHYPETLKHNDVDIVENKKFTITIFKKLSEEKANGIIFLFHGLNEKHWDKYLPWAEKLVTLTGKAVVLFPIAFHMNRLPAAWGDARLMNEVADIRRQHSPSITNSTFANAAISARLQMIPQRFFWSGLQTFYDVVQFIEEIRAHTYDCICSDARIDLFAFSIGSFLSEILMMSDPHGYFSDSKLFIFCGGPTLDRMSPNSKFILDSDATIAIYSFYTERLESELKLNPRIAHYFNGDHRAGNYFKAMLSYQKGKGFREKRFNELCEKIYAITLKRDTVIPPNEVLNTLQGDYREIPITVKIDDFPYPYHHINPFPVNRDIEAIVDASFDRIFEKAAYYLSS